MTKDKKTKPKQPKVKKSEKKQRKRNERTVKRDVASKPSTQAAAAPHTAPHGKVAIPAVVAQRFIIRQGRQRVKDEPSLEVFDTVDRKPLLDFAPAVHFATFPQKLVEPMILAGCPAGGVVLDPFMGSGTTALVARNLGRHYIGCDLNPEYVAEARDRLRMPFTPKLHQKPDALISDKEVAPGVVQSALIVG